MAGVLVIIGGILVHLTLGTFYCAGNLNPFVPDGPSMHAPRSPPIPGPQCTRRRSFALPTSPHIQALLCARGTTSLRHGFRAGHMSAHAACTRLPHAIAKN